MKEKIKELCECVISNDGIIPRDTILNPCMEINCIECPFGSNIDSIVCSDRPSKANYKIAMDYINECYNIDNVNSPKHYNAGKIEVIEAIEDWKLNFNLGNAIKYIARCEHKENKKQDLEKAKWYIERELSKCK